MAFTWIADFFRALALPFSTLRRSYREQSELEDSRTAQGLCYQCGQAPADDEMAGKCIDCFSKMAW